MYVDVNTSAVIRGIRGDEGGGGCETMVDYKLRADM